MGDPHHPSSVFSPRNSMEFHTAVRQCLLELLRAFVGDLRSAEVEPIESGEFLEMFQTGVGDPRSAEVQPIEVGQLLEMFQPSVGDPRSAETQPPKWEAYTRL